MGSCCTSHRIFKCCMNCLLLTNQILTHIDGACDKDDAALDDILHVLVDSQELKCNEDDPQQEYPSTMPDIFPVPPTKDTPPITQAAMASDS